MPVRESADTLEKRLSSRERREPEAIARLRSEARLLELLGAHAGGITPRLLARGEDETGPWHRIERIPLPTIAAHVEAHGPRDPEWVESAMQGTLTALMLLHEAADEAGALDVVHADLSPTNLAVDASGERAVILDLDLAWWRDGPSRDGAFRGTVAYAAPEVARGERPTVASDLFSLAAVLLYAATGKPPRTGASFVALLASAAESPILGPEHAGLAARGPGHAAIVRCLEHEPERRPASARAALALFVC